MASSLITSWQIEGGKVETVTDFVFLSSRITVDDDCSHEIQGHCFLEGKYKNVNCSVVNDFLLFHRLSPTRLLCPWNSPGNNTRVGCHSLLQGILPIQGSNLGLLCLQEDSLPSEHIKKQRHHFSNKCQYSERTTALSNSVKLSHAM